MTDTRQKTGHIPPFGLRMQPELKKRLEEAATTEGRSLNAEIVARLEESLVWRYREDLFRLTGELWYETQKLADLEAVASDSLEATEQRRYVNALQNEIEDAGVRFVKISGQDPSRWKSPDIRANVRKMR